MNWLPLESGSGANLLTDRLQSCTREEVSQEEARLVQVKASKSRPSNLEMSWAFKRQPYLAGSLPPVTLLTACVACLITCSWLVAATPQLSLMQAANHRNQVNTNEAQSHHLQHQPAAQIQSRAGGLEPGDYVDEASELEVMANQQQIPTAQLMAAAGHVVPDSFFLPGGTIPAAVYSRLAHHQHPDQLQQLQARNKLIRANDLLTAAASNQVADQVAQSNQHQEPSGHSFVDYNAYGPADANQPTAQEMMVDFLGPAQQLALQEQQQQHLAEQQLISELQNIVAARQQLQHLQASSQANQYQQQPAQQSQSQQTLDNSAQSSENSPIEANYGNPHAIGPAYQLAGQPGEAGTQYDTTKEKPYGLPTKSSNKEPSGMLKPLGNPKTISSPAIDFVANQLPKTSGFDKLAEKMPQMQTPTIISFASSKDPMDKVKGVNQKKRTVMRQAEHLARMLIKSVNDKFGTNIGEQSDIPFLLSSLGPLGFAQNILFDPSLLVTLLNSAEKTYFSDVLPGPAKSAIRPVLNIFRVPNKKRDKANILNVISYLTSVGQTPTTRKHRQGTGVEKVSKSKSR